MEIHAHGQDNVMEYRGQEPGPASTILAGVHGDEPCGAEALVHLLSSLAIERGTVFIGYGNPRAMQLKQRFIEADLNRMFKPDKDLSVEEKRSYEYARVQILKTYLDQSSALLDIHTSGTEGSEPFLICERNSEDITGFLPFKKVVYGFDTVEPGGTDYYMNTTGRIGICAECGYTEDPSAVAVATQTIRTFLVARGHIDGIANSPVQTKINMYSLYKAKTNSFVLSKKFKDFEEILAGEKIGMDGEGIVWADKDSLILFAQDTFHIGAEAFLLGEVI